VKAGRPAGSPAGSLPLSRLRSRFRFPAPILRGSLAGARWLPAGGGKILRVLLGTYEPEQTALFGELTAPGATVFDVGAHLGYYTLLASRRAGPAGKVVAFEPDPDNFFFLQAHAELNRLSNVTLVESAVGEREGRAVFATGTGSGTGRLAAGPGGISVPVIGLDEYIAAHGGIPDILKIDVEGAEEMVLRGANQLLEGRGPAIFLSTHGPEVHRECCRRLISLGYRLEPIFGADVETATELLCRRG
jgi:FkbM family methyltransferase